MLSTCSKLMHEDWRHVPITQRTQRLQVSAFKSLARGFVGAAREQRLHRNYPFRLLASPWHTDLPRTIAAESQCVRRLDGWSRSFVDLHPDVSTPLARAELVLTNASAREETLRVEKRNGTIRQFIIQRSSGMKAVDLSSLNQFLAKEQVKHDIRKTKAARKQASRQAAKATKVVVVTSHICEAIRTKTTAATTTTIFATTTTAMTIVVAY